jgi:predicted nucleic acid-binding protein
VIIADTSGIIAAFGRNAPRHSQALAAVESDPGPMVLSPYVPGELDYRYDTTRLLTLDERHFRAIRPLHADAFTLLPADS